MMCSGGIIGSEACMVEGENDEWKDKTARMLGRAYGQNDWWKEKIVRMLGREDDANDI
jgi:hypothetical protein